MGLKQGLFYSNDGDLIAVSFYGDKVTTGNIILAPSPVIIQMDGGGGGEYMPVQYATASISCVTNGADLLELCTNNPLDVAVEVYNRTTDKVLFAGCITPNAFNQSIDDINNVITIECVDWLGAAKFVRYRRKNEALQAMTLRESLLHIFGLITSEAEVLLSDFVCITNNSEYLPEHVSPGDGHVVNATTRQYTELVVAETYYYDSPTEPTVLYDGEVDLEMNAMSLYEILAMLAKSFLATWQQFGKRVILVDCVNAALFGGTSAYPLSASIIRTPIDISTNINIDRGKIASGGNSVSVLPFHDRYALHCNYGSRDVLPNFSNHLYYNPFNYFGQRDDDRKTWHYTYMLRTDVLDGVEWTSSYDKASAMAVAYYSATYDDYDDHRNDSPAFGDDWDVFLRIVPPAANIAFKKKYSLSVVAGRFYTLTLRIKAGWSYQVGKPYPTQLEKGTPYNLYVSIKIGDLYYDKESDSWTTEVKRTKIVLLGDGDWKEAFYGMKYYPRNVLTNSTKDGCVEVIISADKYWSDNYAIYIKEFGLTFSSGVNERRPLSDVKYAGNPRGEAEFSAEAMPITFGYPMGEKTFSDTIEGIPYVLSASEGGRSRLGSLYFFDKEDYWYEPLNRVERLANLGDRKEYSLNLKDPRNKISPFDTFTSSLWQGNKIIVAYQKDVEKNIINVTLN